jgi:hypothetical protein
VDGVLAERQAGRDLAVAEPLGDQAQHLELARGERAGLAAREPVDHVARPRAHGGGAELVAAPPGRRGLARRVVHATRPGQDAGQLEPRVRGLEGRAAAGEELDGVLERLPGGVVLARRARDDSRRQARARLQREARHGGRDGPELVEVRPRGPRLAEGRERPGHELEERRAPGRARDRDLPQRALQVIARAGGIAGVQAQRADADGGQRVAVGLGEELGGLGDAALAPTQLGQPDHGLRAPVRAHRGQVGERLQELALGPGPVAVPHQHRGVVGPADPVDEADAHPAAERLHRAAPLRRAVVVAHALARVDQVAAGPAGRRELLVLAAERGRRRLVEAAHAVGDATLVDDREPLGCEAEHLEVDDAQVRAQPPRPRPEPLGLGRVVAEHQVRPERRQPAVLRARLEVAEDALGALEPSVGHGPLAAELEVVVADPQRHPRRAAAIAVAAVAPVGALARLEAERHVVEPPRRPRTALPGRGRLLERQSGFERGARLLPGAAGERLASRVEVVRRRGHATSLRRVGSSSRRRGGRARPATRGSCPRARARARRSARGRPARSRRPCRR